MSRSYPQSTSALWPTNKSDNRFLRKNRQFFYGHKVMDQLRILARLARPAQLPADSAPPTEKPVARAR